MVTRKGKPFMQTFYVRPDKTPKKSTIINQEGTDISVTSSIGISVIDSEDRDISKTLEKADAASYTAKSMGGGYFIIR